MKIYILLTAVLILAGCSTTSDPQINTPTSTTPNSVDLRMNGAIVRISEFNGYRYWVDTLQFAFNAALDTAQVSDTLHFFTEAKHGSFQGSMTHSSDTVFSANVLLDKSGHMDYLMFRRTTDSVYERNGYSENTGLRLHNLQLSGDTLRLPGSLLGAALDSLWLEYTSSQALHSGDHYVIDSLIGYTDDAALSIILHR